ncbi:MAG TPA: ABC transporter permease subunit, partial [Gemmataceae bacterium]|nr:ABC transporter permease subunit [Gemmataceae bacterium]
LPIALQCWLLAAGGFALAGLVIWLLAAGIRALSGPASGRRHPRWASWLLASFAGGACLAIVAAAMPRVWRALGWQAPVAQSLAQASQMERTIAAMSPFWLTVVLFVAGFALVAVSLPVFSHVPRLRWRRIWALARLSIKEAVRSKILWAFSFLVLVFLFGSWFIPAKPEAQVQTYVETVFVVMNVLLLITAGLLASLSIPTDIRRQTIHTIVTKPVERFEIVLGRFLGYLLLMSVVLAAMTFFSLIYVYRGVDEDAKQESLRARVPVFGELRIENGKNVGREWSYRSYITRTAKQEQRAVWTFHKLPAHLADRDTVRLEYDFDIFRTTKGEEGKPVFCSFVFQTARWDPTNKQRLTEYRDKRNQEYTRPNHDPEAVIDNRLAEEYGYYELNLQKVEDYHTLGVEVPGGLFKDLPSDKAAGEGGPLEVVVRCQSVTQFLGVAKHDMYLLDDEGWVPLNFFKGAAGIWFLLCLVIGLAVTCSTYLSGVISFLATLFLLLAGACLPFILELAERKNYGGGPMESLLRLGSVQPISKELDRTPTVVVATYLDRAFSFVLRALAYGFPEVKRFSLTDYVARGFDISPGLLLWDKLCYLVLYLYLWVVLAYYLMRSREIASW